MSHVLAVIPARFSSTRFPGKPLAALGNGTMLEEVWRRTSEAARIDTLVVATDDERIAHAARRFGAETVMTSADHASGTDRAAEVLRNRSERFEIVLVIQCDEPLLTGSCLDRLIGCFDGTPPDLATLSEPLVDVEELFDPNVVKVVLDGRGRALYFSRSPLPYHRGKATRLDPDFRSALAVRSGGLTGYLKHQGLYAYSRKALLELTRMEPSSLERDEGLEQLRALQAGYTIRVIESDFRSFAVDTPEDLERVATMLTEAN
ncbi:MAG: 3-deoxy-manno-octulosonate cytidylyltransferase [Acidobacteria bacterium]|nr:3-deoxy-manno-octulosonate cytidylyltransferase [Acidobacteriota bacterium]NIM61134.1 3-deoxy-manno-octulosonate cytidylyltransferase [Acidobacteriota bacterium]NIO58724.1 3-deoxy-manno-octulosonate cytidylyltransferase [Acidobacteriota bacterium]NIQ29775.1 3-deoxy-manno-octulosonate cytidylyltransferase [Acidobacteriota bacterium]NIQ84495.1 3-deoxy-manno-octulosonate cytidylyltransferase [Acidobacteriota bacterium]